MKGTYSYPVEKVHAEVEQNDLIQASNGIKRVENKIFISQKATDSPNVFKLLKKKVIPKGHYQES